VAGHPRFAKTEAEPLTSSLLLKEFSGNEESRASVGWNGEGMK